MKTPLLDLRASYLEIREELLRRFDEALLGGQLYLGPETRALEREFTAYLGAAHGLAVGSGTDALIVALRAAGVGPGDEVICPSHTFFATVEAIVQVGATPVLADVEASTLTIDPEQVRALVGPATRAVVAVHLYGHLADMDALGAIAREHGLRLIEDAAQAHGARHRGRRCGSLGDAGCFSFYVTKNLGAFGEGGFVSTEDAAIAERVALLRDHGRTSKFEHGIVGQNLRMDELQAAVVRLKLPGLDARNERRREIAARYRQAFEGQAIRLLASRPESEPVHHVYPIQVDERDALREHLAQREIATGIHYHTAAHRQPALAAVTHRRGEMKVTEEACARLVSLPIFPELTDEQVDEVASEVVRFVSRSRPTT